MADELEVDLLNAKADAMYDKAWPGFVHAKRRPEKRQGWVELAFPCGLVCTTNSSPTETELMYNEIFEARQYMRSGIAVSHGDTIVDIGANIGMFTMYLLRNFENLSIHAVEPVSETFEVLSRNMQRFGGRPVHLHNTALGRSEDSTVEIVVYSHMTGNATRYPELKHSQREILAQAFTKEELAYVYQHHIAEVACTTISSLITSNGIKHINLLKVDTEGSEIEILNGIRQHHWKTIDQLVIEVHDEVNSLPKVKSLLDSVGMKTYVDEQSRDPFGTVVVTATRD